MQNINIMQYNFLVDSKIARISDSYAKRKTISIDDAMKLFIGSATYRALSNKDTGLYLEVLEYVYDMFLEEMGENIDET